MRHAELEQNNQKLLKNLKRKCLNTIENLKL